MTIYRCTACESLTQVSFPHCRTCGTTNGYQKAPKGTRMPRPKPEGANPAGGGLGDFGGGLDGPALDFGGGDAGGLDGALGGPTATGPGKRPRDTSGYEDPDKKPRVVSIGRVKVQKRVRLATGIKQLDQVLGGNEKTGYGIVAGSSVMLDGDPGIGKSTLLVQALARLAAQGVVVYATGEEGMEDIRERADRLGILKTKLIRKNLLLVETTNTDHLIEIIEKKKPIAVIMDSVQMFVTEHAVGQAGSEPQCKYILNEMIKKTTKPSGIALFVVSQVTKDGDARGPNTIAHMVDAHLKFERENPKDLADVKRRLWQKKNRNGNIAITGRFWMTDKGLRGLKHADSLSPEELRRKQQAAGDEERFESPDEMPDEMPDLGAEFEPPKIAKKAKGKRKAA